MAASESIVFDGNRMQEEQEEELKQDEDERQQQLKDLLANAFDDLEADDLCSVASDESHDSGRHSDEIGQQQMWNNGSYNRPPNYHASTPVSEARAPPLVTPMIRRSYGSQQQLQTYNTSSNYNYGSDANTITQEPESTSELCHHDNITQYTDPYQSRTVTQNDVAERYQQCHFTGRAMSSNSPQSGSSHTSSSEENHCTYTTAYPPGRASYAKPALSKTGCEDLETTVYGTQQSPANSCRLQEKFFQEGGAATKNQLEILYHAKSRQLQELKEKYELLQLESAKEIRLLRHEAALLQGSTQGREASLKHTQQLLKESKESQFSLQTQLATIEDQYQTLELEKNELSKQLRSAESSIESLNAQIFALGSSDTIERIRDQHESIVNSMQQQHELQIQEINEKMADIKESADQQAEAIETARLSLRADQEAIARERLDHAESINRLTNSLQESQRQTQELLDQSCAAELSKVKIQLQQSNASKTITEQLCQSLQREIDDLKEQVSLYESAQQTTHLVDNAAHGSEANHSEPDDTIAELGIKPLNTDKVQPVFGQDRTECVAGPVSEADTILILRRELQKCLAVVKDKRAEISSLRATCDQKTVAYESLENLYSSVKDEKDKVQVELKEALIELNLYKSAAGEGSSLAEVHLQNQLEAADRNKLILQQEIKSLTEQFELSAANEAKLEEINAELNSKMAELIDDFDRDKKAALERCEQTLESHNQNVREMLRTELQSEFNFNLKKLDGQYNSDITQLRLENSALRDELSQVKSLYIQVCEEKNQQELREKTILQEHQTELDRVLAELNEVKTSSATELDMLKQQLSSVSQSHDTSVVLSACHEQTSVHMPNHSQHSAKSSHSNQSDKALPQLASSAPTTNQIPALEEELNNERKSHSESRCEIVRLESELSHLKAQINELDSAVQQKETKLVDSKNELSQTGNEVKRLTVMLSDLQADKHKLDSFLSAEREQLSKTKFDLSNAESQLQGHRELLKDYDQVMQKVKDIQNQLATANMQIHQLEEELRTEKDAHTQTKEELEVLELGQSESSKNRSLVMRSIGSLEDDLQTERNHHKLARESILRMEAELEIEKANHNSTKIDMVKLETELSSSKRNYLELNRSAEVLRSTQKRLEMELELTCSSDKRNTEVISELKSQQVQDQQQLEGLKASHKQVLSDLNESKAALIRQGSELGQLRGDNSRLLSELDEIAKEHKNQQQLLVNEHATALENAFEEARKESGVAGLPSLVAENKLLKEKLNSLQAEADGYIQLVENADTHFEQQLELLKQQLQEDHQRKLDSLTETVRSKDVILDKERKVAGERAREMDQQISSLTNQMRELETKCKTYQSCTEELRRNLEAVMSQTTQLKTINKKLGQELTQTNSSYELRLDNLAAKLQQRDQQLSDMEHENSLTIQSLKQKMIALRNEHTHQMESARAAHNQLQSQTATPSSADWSKPQYESALRKIRAEVLTYVEETNCKAARLIKSEIHKAKQSTALQLRNYYIKCFKQSLADNISTAEEKLSRLERTLDRAVPSLVNPTNTCSDSVPSAPDLLLSEQVRPPSQRQHVKESTCQSKPTPVIITHNDSSDTRYKYIPLCQRAQENNTTTRRFSSESTSLIRELGLDKVMTSPPRRYNPPPEKLNPSPLKSTAVIGSEGIKSMHT